MLGSFRQLPDGTWFNPDTGDLKGLDGRREQAARAISAAQRLPPANPFPPLPSQRMVVLPSVKGPMQMIAPKRDVLAVNPFEMGMGAMSDTSKRVLLMVGVIGIAAATCWFQRKSKKKG